EGWHEAMSSCHRTVVTTAREFLAFPCPRWGLTARFHDIDAIDRKILAELQTEGRLSLTELSERVHLSLSRCQRRVRELERSGVTRGYPALVDAAAVGFGFEVLVFVTLNRADSVTEFDQAVHDLPQVIEAQRLFGEPDYLLRVVAPDLPSYQQLYDHTLSRLP